MSDADVVTQPSCLLPKPHNKSGLQRLAIVSMGEDERKESIHAYQTATFVNVVGLMMDGSVCRVLKAADGRVSLRGRKISFGYHFAALNRLGLSALAVVSPGKTEPHAMTISHLCGTRNCCSEDHIVIEEKQVNDERTHCHFAITSMLRLNKVPVDRWGSAVERFMEMNFCPHTPRCCSPIHPIAASAPVHEVIELYSQSDASMSVIE